MTTLDDSPFDHTPFEIGDIVKYTDGWYLILRYFHRGTYDDRVGIYNVFYLGGSSGRPQILTQVALYEYYSQDRYLNRFLP